jgi:hypothetical protein
MAQRTEAEADLRELNDSLRHNDCQAGLKYLVRAVYDHDRSNQREWKKIEQGWARLAEKCVKGKPYPWMK